MKGWIFALLVWLAVAALVAWKIVTVRNEHRLEDDRRLVALLVTGGDRCKALADGLLDNAQEGVGSGLVSVYVAAYTKSADVAAELAAEEETRAIVTELFHARSVDQPGRETLLSMATSQERLCGLVRSTGSHSLLTLREAIAEHAEDLAAAEARVGLEIPGVVPRTVQIDPQDVQKIKEASKGAREEWQKRARAEKQMEETRRQERRAAYLAAVDSLKTTYRVFNRAGEVIVVVNGHNVSEIPLSLRLDFELDGGRSYTAQAEVPSGASLDQRITLGTPFGYLDDSTVVNVKLRVSADEDALLRYMGTS